MNIAAAEDGLIVEIVEAKVLILTLVQPITKAITFHS